MTLKNGLVLGLSLTFNCLAMTSDDDWPQNAPNPNGPKYRSLFKGPWIKTDGLAGHSVKVFVSRLSICVSGLSDCKEVNSSAWLLGIIVKCSIFKDLAVLMVLRACLWAKRLHRQLGFQNWITLVSVVLGGSKVVRLISQSSVCALSKKSGVLCVKF